MRRPARTQLSSYRFCCDCDIRQRLLDGVAPCTWCVTAVGTDGLPCKPMFNQRAAVRVAARSAPLQQELSLLPH